ncbi:hypothetical protein G9A89_022410 [Geosiphon pyriformis]|nr:hypothetical protein G9A89_022410 [Geosiphon pyriformis]
MSERRSSPSQNTRGSPSSTSGDSNPNLVPLAGTNGYANGSAIFTTAPRTTAGSPPVSTLNSDSRLQYPTTTSTSNYHNNTNYNNPPNTAESSYYYMEPEESPNNNFLNMYSLDSDSDAEERDQPYEFLPDSEREENNNVLDATTQRNQQGSPSLPDNNDLSNVGSTTAQASSDASAPGDSEAGDGVVTAIADDANPVVVNGASVNIPDRGPGTTGPTPDLEISPFGLSVEDIMDVESVYPQPQYVDHKGKMDILRRRVRELEYDAWQFTKEGNEFARF